MAKGIYVFRLDAEDKANLEEVSKLYGAKTPSEFAREMVAAICSANPERISEFTGKLFQKIGQQMTLDLMAKAQATIETQKPLQKPRKKPVRVKRGGKRGKTT